MDLLAWLESSLSSRIRPCFFGLTARRLNEPFADLFFPLHQNVTCFTSKLADSKVLSFSIREPFRRPFRNFASRRSFFHLQPNGFVRTDCFLDAFRPKYIRLYRRTPIAPFLQRSVSPPRPFTLVRFQTVALDALSRSHLNAFLERKVALFYSTSRADGLERGPRLRPRKTGFPLQWLSPFESYRSQFPPPLWCP